MPEQQVEPEVMDGKDIKNLESSLQLLWEKARRVSESLLQLKEANQALKKRVVELEDGERKLREELGGREGELERVRQELLRLQSNGSGGFSKEEKEELKTRIKELITKISARL